MIDILPAVDVSRGRVAWTSQRATSSEHACNDPLDAALAWQSAGAKWVHLVDLDLAYRRGSNIGLLTDIVARLEVAVELSGGIVDSESLDAALTTGATRVVLGTTALQHPGFVQVATAHAGERLAIGLDVRGLTLAPRGGPNNVGDVFECLEWLDRLGCARYVVTDVDRDGALSGPNLDLLRAVCAATPRPVVASGGTATSGDVRAVASIPGVEGLIIGKALYTGALTLQGALQALSL